VKIKRTMELLSFSTPLDQSAGTSVFVGKNYGIPFHIDAELGFTYGVWVLHHDKSCKINDDSCVKNWYFYFPEIKIRIALQNNTFIIFDATNPHATCQGTATCGSKCAATQYGISIQNKKKLVTLVDLEGFVEELDDGFEFFCYECENE